MCKWFSKDWYEYLFSNLDDCDGFWDIIRRIRCRMKDHKLGHMYHASGMTALEPDYHCSYCDDEL